MAKIRDGKGTMAFLFVLFIFLYSAPQASLADVLTIPGEKETAGSIESPEATESGSGEPTSKEGAPEESTTEVGEVVEPSVSVQEAPKPEETKAEAPVEKRYVVKEGDTLWGIAHTFMDDPFLWPKLWKDNKFIINPDLIYPRNVIIIRGDEIIIVEAKPEEVEKKAPPVAEEPVAEEVVTPPPAPVVEEAAPAEPPKPVEVVAPPAKVDPLSILAAGYITKKESEKGIIAGSLEEGKELLGEGDIVYIVPKKGQAVQTGEKYVAYRNVRKVIHPKTKKYIGDLIRILGVIEVSDNRGKVSTAKVVTSFDYITIGDNLMAYEQAISAVSESESRNTSKSSANLKGYIIDVKDEKVANAQFDVVYIDKGLKDGVLPDDSFIVIKEGAIVPPSFSPARGTSFPEQVVAELKVINVRDNTATAKVTNSVKAIERGDFIKAKVSE